MYWDTSTGISRPRQVTVREPGRRVVAVRKGAFPAWPSRIAERRRAIGKSGFVIRRACEKDGTWRSTRSLGGEQPRPLFVPQASGVTLGGGFAAVAAAAQAAAASAASP